MFKLKYLLCFVCIAVLLVACSGDSADSHEHDDHDHAHETNDDNKDADEPHADESDEGHGDEEHDEHESDEHDEHDDHDEDEESREHGAHEHGAAELNIAWSGNALAVDLISPSYNILGFEYTPSTDEEKQAADDSVATLKQGDFLQFTAAAECAVVSAEIHAGFLEADGADDETHSDIDVEYTIECANPEDLTNLDLSELFSQFANFEDLQVQWISDEDASAETVTPSNATISFK